MSSIFIVAVYVKYNCKEDGLTLSFNKLLLMETYYCIYTDKYVLIDDSNLEHIIPLSLGGCNEFTLRVNAEKNTELGTRIDGKLTNDFFIATIRKVKGYLGHKNNPPQISWKKSRIENTNKPVNVTLTQKGAKFYDPIARKDIHIDSLQGLTLSSKFTFDRDIRMLFCAKVALAAGYFIYGDIFREYADHASLRSIMNFSRDKDVKSLKDIPVRFYDQFSKVEIKDKGLTEMLKLMCKLIDDSCVIFLLEQTSLIVTVGIGGQYLGTISFPANTTHFPNDEEFRLGYAVGIQKGVLEKASFYKMVELLKGIIP